MSLDSSPVRNGPGWIARLAELLAGNEGAVVETALAMVEGARGLDRAQLVQAAVLAAITEMPAGPALILTRRRDGLPQHGGQVALPGGAIDPEDASPEAAALREAEEEIALAPTSVRILGRLPRYPTGSGFFLTPVVGYVQKMPRLTPAPAEVAEIFFLPLAVLLNPECWEERTLRFGRERIRHRELPYEGRRIWGATANVLQLLVPTLQTAYHG